MKLILESKNPEVEKILEKLVIQRIRGKDFDQLFRLMSNGFKREIAIAGFDTRRLSRAARFYRQFSSFLPLIDVFHVDFPTILVAMSGDILVGAIHLVPHSNGVWTIDSVAVDTTFRGHGVYRRLMKEALKYISEKRGKQVEQSVWTDNVAPLKVAGELEFEVLEEDILLVLEFSEVPLIGFGKDILVRDPKPTDKEQIYEIRRSIEPRRIAAYENAPGDHDGSLVRYVVDKLVGSRSRRWVIEVRGKIAGYASVRYTSPSEAGHIEHFCVIPSNDSSKLESILMNTILAFFAMKNVSKVVASLDKERKQTLEIFKQARFKPVTSLYEMIKTMKPAPLEKNLRICLVTETDFGARQISGSLINDSKMLRQLKKFGDVEIIYLQRERYRTIYSSLPVYILQILRSLFKPYRIYFTRSILASYILTSLRPIGRPKIKVVHQAFSVPLPSSEAKSMGFGMVESFVRMVLFGFLEKRALPKVDFITIAADDYAKALVRIGVKPNRIHVVHFPVEDAFFKQPTKKESSIFTLCYVGSFQVYHRLLPLIEALELVCKTEENVRLLLVGVGPHRSKLEREVERRRLTEKVRFLGQFSHSSLPSFLSGIDCFVSLIPKFGISISLLEAAASAKVILAFTPDDALSRFFAPGEHIYLLNTLAPNEIANAVKTIHRNSKLKDNLAKGAREIAQRNFSEQVVSRQLQELLRKIYEDDQPLHEVQ